MVGHETLNLITDVRPVHRKPSHIGVSSKGIYVPAEGSMTRPYISPPTKEEIVYQFADWIARLFRVRVTITLDDLSGSRNTVEIEHPDKQYGEYPQRLLAVLGGKH